jgi:flagellar basal-body rod protein FlgB
LQASTNELFRLKVKGDVYMIERILNRSRALEKSLDATWLRNEAISQNIANVDTPGYKKKTVAFEELLSSAIDKNSLKGFRTDPRHIPIGGSNVEEIPIKITEDNKSLAMRLDGNNVDIDSEMADLAKNSIQYNTVTQSLNTQFKRIKSAINEGRR